MKATQAFQQVVLALLLLLSVSSAFPTCDEGDLMIEQTCNVFGDEDGLSWAVIDIQYPSACWDNNWCKGNLAGVRCFKGSGFTARRYNKWECLESCTVPSE